MRGAADGPPPSLIGYLYSLMSGFWNSVSERESSVARELETGWAVCIMSSLIIFL